MYCISYNLYKYIQRLSLLIFSTKGSWGGGGSCYTGARWREAGWEIKGEGVGKVFVVSVCGRGKNGSLYTNGAPGQPRGGRGGGSRGEKILSLPGGRKTRASPGGQCATAKSSLQSIHSAEVHFFKKGCNWGQRSRKPVVLHRGTLCRAEEQILVFWDTEAGQQRYRRVWWWSWRGRGFVGGATRGWANPWLWPYWRGGAGRMGGSRKGALVWGWSACGWSVRREGRTTCGGTGRPD